MVYQISGQIIHGHSFAVHLETVEFLTVRLNEETGEYWLKMHLPSGKEIRIKVDYLQLNSIMGEWAMAKGNDVYPEFNNGDKNELENGYK
jgi:hypothetical protein|tara:strand:+ start:7433 stop:7702 length:270 start_codon:yes stop_codon:yes gene_type:complete